MLFAPVEPKKIFVMLAVDNTDPIWIQEHAALFADTKEPENLKKRTSDNGSASVAINKIMNCSDLLLLIVVLAGPSQKKFIQPLLDIYGDRIDVRYHSDFLDAADRPCANSRSIQMNLWKLKVQGSTPEGIFLMDDDMYFMLHEGSPIPAGYFETCHVEKISNI